jgi:hypothetical protein
MADWPRLIHDHDAGKERLTVEAEIDDDFVLHVIAKSNEPSDDSIAVGGTTVKFPAMELESWVYLPEESARRLYDALGEYLQPE